MVESKSGIAGVMIKTLALRNNALRMRPYSRPRSAVTIDTDR